MRVAVLTLTHNRLEYTIRTIAGLRRTAGGCFEHIVVDDGSGDGTVEWLKAQKDIHLVRVPVRLGIAEATNLGIDKIKELGIPFTHVIKVDNDCDFYNTPWGWLPNLACLVGDRPWALSPEVTGLRYPVPTVATEEVGGYMIRWTGAIGGLCTCWRAEDFLQHQNHAPQGRRLYGMANYLCNERRLQRGYVVDFSVEHMDTTDGQVKRYPKYFEEENR